MGKRWKNHHKPAGLKSFHIELIMAHLLEKNGTGGNIEKRFRDFLLYIAQSGLKDRIDFVENCSSSAVEFSDSVVIVDPVNNRNNAASRITETERMEITQVANQSWEDAVFASEENDVELWKEVFGPRFKVEDDE